MTTETNCDMTADSAASPAVARPDARESEPPIGPAGSDEIDAIIELLKLMPPTSWIMKLSRPALTRFLGYSIKSRRAVLLLARSRDEIRPAGYVFAISDPRWFWIDFAARHPADALAILFHRSRRIFAQRRAASAHASGLPAFAWSESSPRTARILGLCVYPDQRRRGIAMNLYFKLFDALRELGCTKVEEYMGPNYPQYAGKFPEVCGWQLQPCSRGGYKITKAL